MVKASTSAPSAAQQMKIVIPVLRTQTMTISLIGDTPLICHRWTPKAMREILDKQMGKAKMKKEPKDPEKDFRESLYVHPDGGYGFPTIAFKAAAVSSCRFADGVKMTEARGSFHIDGELVKIIGEPTMREDMVKVGMGVADIRYRGEFLKWRTTFDVRYNINALSPEVIVNLFNISGFGVGIGEWRAERDGSHGLFHVASQEEIEVFEATRSR